MTVSLKTYGHPHIHHRDMEQYLNERLSILLDSENLMTQSRFPQDSSLNFLSRGATTSTRRIVPPASGRRRSGLIAAPWPAAGDTKL